MCKGDVSPERFSRYLHLMWYGFLAFVAVFVLTVVSNIWLVLRSVNQEARLDQYESQISALTDAAGGLVESIAVVAKVAELDHQQFTILVALATGTVEEAEAAAVGSQRPLVKTNILSGRKPVEFLSAQ